jgi:hypothetical protein
VRAASWDIEWELRGAWTVVLQRRDLAGVPLPLADPCVMEIRHIDRPRDTPAIKTFTGAVDTTTTAHKFELHASAADISALGAGRFEHVILVGVPGEADPVVLVDGFLKINDRAGR